MFKTLEEKTEEKAMVQFLERFTDYPFLVKFKNSEYHIGEGEPTFTVNFKKAIPLADLMKSTSLALGEAYMRGDLDIEGNLYEALVPAEDRRTDRQVHKHAPPDGQYPQA